MSSDQEPRREMTEADAHAFMTRLAERLGVSVEQLTELGKESETSAASLNGFSKATNETIRHLSLNRRQRRKMNRNK